ncbi:MAG: HlyD family efflux transporter periplasmic adaptor subunit [Stigonema ocellatum SAG 48.90 = DSM 106950]|nr:HlyD family efflux transporter periplasmic adaptor subunit [Stigonema ocellatum SAG 48.90 = DSM 106950]
MPLPSRNSSSGLTKQEQMRQESYTESKDVAESTALNSSIEGESSERDWFYGTEELLDALPRPWTLSVLYVLISLTLVILPWSMLAKVDETGSARGRIEPLGATQKLDSQASGNVIVVRVKEGDTVQFGQILVELDSKVLRTELQQSQAKLSGQRSQQAQLQLLKNQLLLTIHTQQQQNQAQQLEKLAQVEQARQNLDALKSAYNLQKEEKLAKLNQVRQTIDSSKAAYQLAQVRLEGAKEKAPRYKKAFEDGAIPQDRFLEVQQSVKENYQNLVQAQFEVSRSQSSLQEQQSSYERTIHQAQADIQQAELRLQEQERSKESIIHTGELAVLKIQEQFKDLQSQITTLQSQIAQTISQITSLNLQLEQRVVRSPINGVIFELPIKKPGAVVQPGQRIAQIAPKNTGFILKAQIPIQNSGFLKVGMPVKIKFDAYPFQDYGIVPGEVRWISPDSKHQQTSSDNIETFELDITLKQLYIESGNKRISLAPGQTATAEVIIRQRSVIDYMLDPFKKLNKGGVNL